VIDRCVRAQHEAVYCYHLSDGIYSEAPAPALWRRTIAEFLAQVRILFMRNQIGDAHLLDRAAKACARHRGPAHISSAINPRFHLVRSPDAHLTRL
jgi:hypothetical protein